MSERKPRAFPHRHSVRRRYPPSVPSVPSMTVAAAEEEEMQISESPVPLVASVESSVPPVERGEEKGEVKKPRKLRNLRAKDFVRMHAMVGIPALSEDDMNDLKWNSDYKFAENGRGKKRTRMTADEFFKEYQTMIDEGTNLRPLNEDQVDDAIGNGYFTIPEKGYR